MSDRPAFGAKLVKDTLDRELKQARVIFLLIGLANIILSLLAWNTLSDQLKQAEAMGYRAELSDAVRIIVFIGIAVGVVYLLCAYFVYQKPVPTTIIALVIYGAFTVIQLAIDPSAIFSVFGLGLRIAMIIALVSAVRFAMLYERNRSARPKLGY